MIPATQKKTQMSGLILGLSSQHEELTHLSSEMGFSTKKKNAGQDLILSDRSQVFGREGLKKDS